MSSKAAADSQFKPPFKPRPGLFYLLFGLFVLWLVVLVVMFVTTVYPHPQVDPHRRPSTDAAPAKL